ncbi:MAG: cupin domain-containing protein [Rhodospirillaceae bacterium]|nr:cupin domain-containing protein [Rhodospirillaceae bacterium]
MAQYIKKKNSCKSLRDLPAQVDANPETAARSRARYFNSGNAFMVGATPIPDIVFEEEPRKAFADGTPTSLIPCDISSQLGCNYPATSPLILVYYARINYGEVLSTLFNASGALAYVISGSGETICQDEVIKWGEGDVFLMPGGKKQTHRAFKEPVILWIATNEPQLEFENSSIKDGTLVSGIVHYPSQEIDRQFDLIYSIDADQDVSGSAVIFSSCDQELNKNILPTLTAGINSLPPNAKQRPHRHNGIAISLVIGGEGCFSLIDGKKKKWLPWVTMITPPVSVHSHHNESDKMAKFLIVQDAGIYTYTRAMGFEFVDK